MTKAEKIRQSRQQTLERRQHQACKVYELKLQNLSKADTRLLNRMFLEAKWLYNHMADIENRLTKDAWKTTEVEVKTPEGMETRQIEVLSSQIRQGIVERIRQNLKALRQAKEKGHKVGRLKFKSEVRSIPLKQYGYTYRQDFARNRVKILAQHASLTEDSLQTLWRVMLPYALRAASRGEQDGLEHLLAYHNPTGFSLEEWVDIYEQYKRVMRSGADFLVAVCYPRLSYIGDAWRFTPVEYAHIVARYVQEIGHIPKLLLDAVRRAVQERPELMKGLAKVANNYLPLTLPSP